MTVEELIEALKNLPGASQSAKVIITDGEVDREPIEVCYDSGEVIIRTEEI